MWVKTSDHPWLQYSDWQVFCEDMIVVVVLFYTNRQNKDKKRNDKDFQRQEPRASTGVAVALPKRVSTSRCWCLGCLLCHRQSFFRRSMTIYPNVGTKDRLALLYSLKCKMDNTIVYIKRGGRYFCESAMSTNALPWATCELLRTLSTRPTRKSIFGRENTISSDRRRWLFTTTWMHVCSVVLTWKNREP